MNSCSAPLVTYQHSCQTKKLLKKPMAIIRDKEKEGEAGEDEQ
jgi:hypothetical protein